MTKERESEIRENAARMKQRADAGEWVESDHGRAELLSALDETRAQAAVQQHALEIITSFSCSCKDHLVGEECPQCIACKALELGSHSEMLEELKTLREAKIKEDAAKGQK